MVELELPDAEARRAAWNTIKTTSGVVDLVDLGAISIDTLRTFLLPDDADSEAIRMYSKRVRTEGGKRSHA